MNRVSLLIAGGPLLVFAVVGCGQRPPDASPTAASSPVSLTSSPAAVPEKTRSHEQIFEVTSRATTELKRYSKSYDDAGDAWWVRVEFVPGGCQGYTTSLKLVGTTGPEDAVVDCGEVKIQYRRDQFSLIQGGKLDWRVIGEQEGLHLEFPQKTLENLKLGKALMTKAYLDNLAGDIAAHPDDADLYLLRAYEYETLGQFDKALLDHDSMVALRPQSPNRYYARGRLHNKLAHYDLARADFSESIRLCSIKVSGENQEDQDSDATWKLESLAWLYATCPDETCRDGVKGITLATQACELTQWKVAKCLQTLAAAHAEAAEFSKAIEWQTKACEMLPENARDEQQAVLLKYREGKPLRDPAK